MRSPKLFRHHRSRSIESGRDAINTIAIATAYPIKRSIPFCPFTPERDTGSSSNPMGVGNGWECPWGLCRANNRNVTSRSDAWWFPVVSAGVKVGATTVEASRHRLIGVCNDRHDRHSSAECEGQGEDYGQLFHDGAPLFSQDSCQNLLGASVTAITFWTFSARLALRRKLVNDGKRLRASRVGPNESGPRCGPGMSLICLNMFGHKCELWITISSRDDPKSGLAKA
jgi:hypothetical protein